MERPQAAVPSDGPAVNDNAPAGDASNRPETVPLCAEIYAV